MKKLLVLESQEDLEPRRQLFLRTLRKNGYGAKVLLWNRSGIGCVDRKQNGIEFESIDVRGKYADARLSLKIFQLYGAFSRKVIKEAPDVIFCGHFFLLPLAVVLAKAKGSNIFYDVMEYYIHDFFGRIPKAVKWLRPLAYAVENLLVKACDGVTTIPSNGNCLVARYRRHNLNVEEVKNVPVLDKESRRADERDDVVKWGDAKRTVLYAGTISEEWGIMKLLQAMVMVKNRYPQIFLLILGKTRLNYEHAISTFVHENGLVDNVRFPGFVPYNKLYRYLRSAVAGIVPMQPVKKFELVGNGTSRKVFEYMNAGLPVIASDFGGLAQAVREEECGILVDSTRPEKIAEAIMFLVENPEKAVEMGRRGRKAVEEKYNWGIEKGKLLRVFENLWKGDQNVDRVASVF
jgi:glycosyltransferase involved in cell wall biosynthesis